MPRPSFRLAAVVAVVLFCVSPVLAAEPPAATSPQAWTLDEARHQARLHPDDAYLQYVVLQLARNEGREEETLGELSRWGRPLAGPDNREVDLFALFTAAHAVQETLQLDTMRNDTAGLTGGMGDRSRETVKIASLEGPQVESHPWGKMLAAQRLAGAGPEVSPLALAVPEDQYFVLFGSVEKLLQAAELGDLWGAHLFSQAAGSARTYGTSGTLKTQLATPTEPLTRPFYDAVVDEVALTGSDLYFRTGNDVTLLFAVRQPQVFRLRMDSLLAAAEKANDDATRTTGKIVGAEYVHVATPDRRVCVYSAYPKPDLHVRSNSLAGLTRVLETVAGKTDGDRPPPRPLGTTTEFKYIRTLMPRGAEEEDGFIYLSDPFIRRVVGPELKLTERRRMLCYNHLRMIGHAAMLHRTQYGKPAGSLEAMAVAGCAPGVFGEGGLRCPDGGRYRLSEDGTTGVCSVHGHAGSLVPCVELAVDRVTEEEADQYRQFVTRYSQYWRRFFDPIAVRLRISAEEYRAETIILPLIDNSIYSGLALALGGEPEPLDGLPVPGRNIFSVAARWNKEALLADGGARFPVRFSPFGWRRTPADVSPEDEALFRAVLARGIGSQIGMHVYDASPTFDFNMSEFLGEVLGSFRGRRGFDDEVVWISFLVASLNSPVYVSVPVEDADLVDRFLDRLDVYLAESAQAWNARDRGWFNQKIGYYHVPLEGADRPGRGVTVAFGPVKWRTFFARVGDGLYLASKRFILEDLIAMEAGRAAGKAAAPPADPGPAAHAMVRIRPEHWNQVLPTFRLGWAEAARDSCLKNLGPLDSVARAAQASSDGPVTAESILAEAERLHAVGFFCPDGGTYALSPDGSRVTCTVHGTESAPRQGPAPADQSPMGRLMGQLGGATETLTYLEYRHQAYLQDERQK